MSSGPCRYGLEIDTHHQYAVLGQPARKYLWILSRSPQMGESLCLDLLKRIVNKGYALSLIERTRQPAEY